eukprot:6006763-Lingulodinium_polyedra.AAC.1
MVRNSRAPAGMRYYLRRNNPTRARSLARTLLARRNLSIARPERLANAQRPASTKTMQRPSTL